MSCVIFLPQTLYSVQIRLRVCDRILHTGCPSISLLSAGDSFFFFFYVYAPNSKEETRRSSENQRKRKNAEEVISTEHECPTGRSCGGRRESDARGLIFRFIVDAQLDGRQSSSFPSLLDATCWKAMRRHLLAENAEEGRREKKKKKISIPVLAWAGSGGGSWNSQRSFGQVPNMNCKSVGAMELATLSGS